MKKAGLLSFLVVIFVSTMSHATMVHGVYHGDWYGVRVKLPEKNPYCGGNDPPNNGVVLALGRRNVNCKTLDQYTARTIDIFGLPNSGEDAENMTLDAAYEYECHLFKGCTGEHPSLVVRGRQTRSGVIKGEPSRIFVLFQQGDMHLDGVDIHNEYNITVTLQTDAAHREEDMKVMREFLTRLQLFKPTN